MYIEVDYRFPPEIDATRQGKIIAIGQTAGTWSARYAHRQTQFQKHLGEVINIKQEHTGYSIATVKFPVANVENDVASLLTMIFGKYSMAGPAKVIAVRLPSDYGISPKVGISGIRARLGVSDRPLIMAIFKPALGLTAAEHGEILAEAASGGLDIIKDEEILGDLETAPTLKRLEACLKVLETVKQSTGKNVLYATNVTGSADKLIAKARLLVKEGANALLLNVLSYGYSVLGALASDPEINVPIFAHPALAGAMCGSPDHGFNYSVLLGTLMAYGGADAVLYPSHYGRLPFEATEEEKIRDILRSRNVFPVPSAGINPGIVPQALKDYGNDVILNAGTAIMDHPEGIANGVKAFFLALDKLKNIP